MENKGERSLRLYSVSLDGWLTQWQVVGGTLLPQLTLALPPHHYIGTEVDTLASPHNHNTTNNEDTLVPPQGMVIAHISDLNFNIVCISYNGFH